MRISFIVPTYNSHRDLRSYLDTFITSNDTKNVSFFIVETSDDQRLPALVDEYKKWINIELHFVPNRGYASACNYGHLHSIEADIYVFSNPDIVFVSDVVTRIRSEFDSESYGSVIQKDEQGRVRTFDLYPQYKSLVTELLRIHRVVNWLRLYHPAIIFPVGAFMIIGKNVLTQTGPFDERFFMYYEEADYFFRLRRNKNTKILRDVYVIHKVSSSTRSDPQFDAFLFQIRSLYQYCIKYGDFSYFDSLIRFYRLRTMFNGSHQKRLDALLVMREV